MYDRNFGRKNLILTALLWTQISKNFFAGFIEFWPHPSKRDEKFWWDESSFDGLSKLLQDSTHLHWFWWDPSELSVKIFNKFNFSHPERCPAKACDFKFHQFNLIRAHQLHQLQLLHYFNSTSHPIKRPFNSNFRSTKNQFRPSEGVGFRFLDFRWNREFNGL